MNLIDALIIAVGVMLVPVPVLTWRFANAAKIQFQQAQQTQQEINNSLETTLQEIRELAGQSALLSKTHADREFSAMAFITGESSFCCIEPSRSSTNPNRWFPVVVQHGNYPCYDIDIRIVDLYKVDTIDETLPIYERQRFTDCLLPVGTMPPQRTKPLPEHQFSAIYEQGFDIYITARNGYYLQQLRFAKIDKQSTNRQWAYTYELKQYRKGSFSKMIHRYTESDFPKAANIN